MEIVVLAYYILNRHSTFAIGVEVQKNLLFDISINSRVD